MKERVARLAELVKHAAPRHPSASGAGRSSFTRAVDRLIFWIRHYLPPLHWIGAFLFGTLLFAYAWLVAYTARLVSVGDREWPDIPQSSVLTIWHGAAPCLLATIARRKPRSRMVIVIATEPRGDSLMVLCRLLGFHVIRGDWEHHGWSAMERTAELVSAGACAVITPDGGGPQRLARPGALILAEAAMAPLVAVGADCRPALTEPHKWDRPRNPVPFGRIAISISEPQRLPGLQTPEDVEAARLDLEQALDSEQGRAVQALADRGGR